MVQVKGNCSKLYGHIALYTALATPISTYETYEKVHGRTENRTTILFKSDDTTPKGWNHITRFIKVRRWGTRNGKNYDKTHYYILSKSIDHAQVVAKGIRGHWGVENKLHWVKDVNFKEDFMTIVKHSDAVVIAILNTVCVNLFRLAGIEPTKDCIALFTNKIKELNFLCRFKTCF